MITLRKEGYTVRMYKDGTIKTEYARKSADYLINFLVTVGGVALLLFWAYQTVQIFSALAK